MANKVCKNSLLSDKNETLLFLQMFLYRVDTTHLLDIGFNIFALTVYFENDLGEAPYLGTTVQLKFKLSKFNHFQPGIPIFINSCSETDLILFLLKFNI